MGKINGKLIKLSIAMDYPAGWNFRYVLRDIVQNFYDSIGPERFSKDLLLEITGAEDGTLEMELKTFGRPFSYEWLTYIGGSTKTGDHKSVGKYGEGFKICVLRILQLGGMELSMHSRDWMICPAVYEEEIDGRNVRMLGYDYTEVPDDGWTVFRLKNIPGKYADDCRECLLDFFYPENPLFGECLTDAEDVQAYLRSDLPIPCRQYAPDLKGILYVNRLASGRLDIPLVINIRDDINDRGRRTLDEYPTAKLLHKAVGKLGAEASFRLLELLKEYWNDLPKRLYDYETKYYLICILVRNVSSDESLSRTFREKYPDLCYIERKTADRNRNRLIREASEWAKGKDCEKSVNPVFRLLGAQSVIRMYEEAVQDAFRVPTEIEQKRMNIVYKAVLSVCRVRLQAEQPELLIGPSDAEFRPLQYADRKYGKHTGKYRISRLVMTEEDFLDDAFRKCFLKTASAMLHVHGTDSSRILTVMLTELGGWILEADTELMMFENLWDTAGKKQAESEDHAGGG